MTVTLYTDLLATLTKDDLDHELEEVINKWRNIVPKTQIVAELTALYTKVANRRHKQIILSHLSKLIPGVELSFDNSTDTRALLYSTLQQDDPIDALRSLVSSLLQQGLLKEEVVFELTLIHLNQDMLSERGEDAIVDVLTDLHRN